jgi:hypothetical protein
VTANGAAVPIDQAAACWLAAAGDFAYTANAGSGSIGHYAVDRRRRQLRADPRNLPCEAGNRFFPPPGQSSP